MIFDLWNRTHVQATCTRHLGQIRFWILLRKLHLRFNPETRVYTHCRFRDEAYGLAETKPLDAQNGSPGG